MTANVITDEGMQDSFRNFQQIVGVKDFFSPLYNVPTAESSLGQVSSNYLGV